MIKVSKLDDYWIEDLEKTGTTETTIFNSGTENEAKVDFIYDDKNYALFIDGVLETSSFTTHNYVAAFNSCISGLSSLNFLHGRLSIGIVGGGDHELLKVFSSYMYKEDEGNFEVQDPCIDEYLKFPYFRSLNGSFPNTGFLKECVTYKNTRFVGFETKKDLIFVDVSDELDTGNSTGFYSDNTVRLLCSSANPNALIIAYDPLCYFKNHKDLEFVKGNSYYCPYYKQEITVNALKVADHAVVA